MQRPGLRVLCVREVQKSLKESSKRLIEDKIVQFGQASRFEMLATETRSPGGGLFAYVGMSDHTAESIKSYEGFDVAIVEEAHTLSARSWEMLRPTIRKPGSEIWCMWNPRSPDDPIDKFFRGLNPPDGAVITQMNWRDNPWFPPELNEERLHDKVTNPDRYGHIWEGDYEPVVVGALWNRQMFHAHRIDKIPGDLERIVVGVDPAISAEEHSDEHGIVVAGHVGGIAYVLEDASLKGSPRQWAERVVAMYDKYDADAIVVERNQGGDMVKHTLSTVRPGLPVVEVHATRGKHVRAEPIAALYSVGRAVHVGTHDKLETQFCQITPSGYEGKGSPDAADGAIWALTELMKPMQRKKVTHINWDEDTSSGRGWLGG